MKKTIWILIVLFLCLAISATGFSISYKNMTREVGNFNNQFEAYKDKEITGSELGTVMNKVIDENEKQKVAKDQEGMYIENEDTSIIMEVHIKDNDTVYRLETFYKLGTERFIQNFSTETFKCTKIEYHNKSKRARYLYFEQL